ncbi:hypothetical protein Tsubulata_025001 [Turnera subulata]|uniref:Uncharacterized protein n=1 Tax=Turnera subulata TaxID=218843 RepID=A0A9Q0FRQ0_9ROSI|nr:hypothetical protein Tsubulata_025001 [Turnera subulata]
MFCRSCSWVKAHSNLQDEAHHFSQFTAYIFRLPPQSSAHSSIRSFEEAQRHWRTKFKDFAINEKLAPDL